MRDLVKMNLQIDVGEDADEEELDRLTRQLRDEMRELEVEEVELVREKTTPEGARGDAVTLGALAVAVLPVAIPKLIDFLRDWLMRGENRTVKIIKKVGDRSLEMEFPETMSQSRLKELVDMLIGQP